MDSLGELPDDPLTISNHWLWSACLPERWELYQQGIELIDLFELIHLWKNLITFTRKILSSASLFVRASSFTLSITSKMGSFASAIPIFSRNSSHVWRHLIVRQIDVAQSQSFHDPTQQGNEFKHLRQRNLLQEDRHWVSKRMPLPFVDVRTENVHLQPFNWLGQKIGTSHHSCQVWGKFGRKAQPFHPYPENEIIGRLLVWFSCSNQEVQIGRVVFAKIKCSGNIAEDWKCDCAEHRIQVGNPEIPGGFQYERKSFVLSDTFKSIWIYGFHSLPFELNDRSARNNNICLRFVGIPPNSGFSDLYFKNAKIAQFNIHAWSQSLIDVIKSFCTISVTSLWL